MNIFIGKKDWLLPVTLILFLLAVVLFPFAVDNTYAGRNESPHHTLTYTTGSLVWDSATDVDTQTGVARLHIFSSTYQNVEADNGDKVIAPGTERKTIVRLQNNAKKTISYIAVMYRIKEEDTLPVQPVLEDNTAYTDIDDYPLPQGVTENQVVRAVTGIVEAEQLQDFDITWLWQYYESNERDQLDTALGNKAAWETADDVTVGLYIVVIEENSPDNPDDMDDSGDTDNPGDLDDEYTRPEAPKTGDSTNLSRYLVLMGMSGILVLILLLERWKEKR